MFSNTIQPSENKCSTIKLFLHTKQIFLIVPQFEFHNFVLIKFFEKPSLKPMINNLVHMATFFF